MNLEGVLERARGLEKFSDQSQFALYDSETLQLVGSSVPSMMHAPDEGRFAVFSLQSIGYSERGSGKFKVGFNVRVIAPEKLPKVYDLRPIELVIPPLLPYMRRIYMVDVWAEDGMEKARYLIRGNFGSDCFMAKKAMEVFSTEPEKIMDLDLKTAEWLMGLLMGSNLFAQTTRDNEIAVGILNSTRHLHSMPFIRGSALHYCLESNAKYAELLRGDG